MGGVLLTAQAALKDTLWQHVQTRCVEGCRGKTHGHTGTHGAEGYLGKELTETMRLWIDMEENRQKKGVGRTADEG